MEIAAPLPKVTMSDDTSYTESIQQESNDCSVKSHKKGDCIVANGSLSTFLQYTPSGSGANIILRENNTKLLRFSLTELNQVD